MTLTPITSLSLATGETKNVTVVDQNGNPLPDSSIQFQSGSSNVSSVPDQVNGGFTFTGILAGSETLTATHIPSGHTAVLPISVTTPVTAISFATI